MAEEDAESGGAIANARRIDKRILGVIYIYMVAAMITSSWMVTITGLDARIEQLGVAIVLGVFWTGYYALAIHPRVLDYSTVED